MSKIVLSSIAYDGRVFYVRSIRYVILRSFIVINNPTKKVLFHLTDIQYLIIINETSNK